MSLTLTWSIVGGLALCWLASLLIYWAWGPRRGVFSDADRPTEPMSILFWSGRPGDDYEEWDPRPLDRRT